MSVNLLSIVIPVYKSAPTLELLYAEISKSLDGRVPFEVVFVDDGSNDGSWNVLQKIKQAHPGNVTAIKFSRNFGQHNAIACGFGFANGEIIVTMDDDLQHPPAEIVKLLEKYEATKADVVYGIYTTKQHSQWRNAGSGILRGGAALEGKSGVGSSFRLITKSLATKIASHLQSGFLFIDEVIHWYTANIVGVSVEHHPRREGKSTYSGRKLFRMYLNILVNYSALPLKVMTWLGLFFSLVSFAFGIRFIYHKLVHGSVPGFTALIVTVLFSTSLLMFCMGIVGQYLYKLYQMQNRRPQFLVEEVL